MSLIRKIIYWQHSFFELTLKMIDKCREWHKFLFTEIKWWQLLIYLCIIILIILWFAFVISKLVDMEEMGLKDAIERIVAIIGGTTLLGILIAIFRRTNKLLDKIDEKLWKWKKKI